MRSFCGALVRRVTARVTDAVFLAEVFVMWLRED